MIDINALLKSFPDPSSTMTAAKMPEDEILGLLEASIPNVWQRHMRLQGFKPRKSSVKKFVEFCERLESTKDVPPKKGADKSTNQDS